MEYIAYLHKDGESDFGVSFPDFPGCITAGRTLEEARKMAAEALKFHIEGMAEDSEVIPEPSSMDQVAEQVARTNAIPFMVSVDAADVTVRVNITARESQIATIDELAQAAGLTRSAYMVQSSIHASAAVAQRGRIMRNRRSSPRRARA